MSFRHLHSLITGVTKNKCADFRGEIALFARAVDLSDQHRQRQMVRVRDSFQASPEWLLKADAGLLCLSITTERLRTVDFIRVPELPQPGTI